MLSIMPKGMPDQAAVQVLALCMQVGFGYGAM